MAEGLPAVRMTHPDVNGESAHALSQCRHKVASSDADSIERFLVELHGIAAVQRGSLKDHLVDYVAVHHPNVPRCQLVLHMNERFVDNFCDLMIKKDCPSCQRKHCSGTGRNNTLVAIAVYLTRTRKVIGRSADW